MQTRAIFILASMTLLYLGPLASAYQFGYPSQTITGTVWFDGMQSQTARASTAVIQNASFESGTSNYPDNWGVESIQGATNFYWDASIMHSGGRSVKVYVSGQGIARWVQTVQMDQDSEYELSGWIKTSNVQDPSGQWWTTGAKLGVYGMDSYLAAATPGLRDSNDWTYVSVRFVTGRTTLAKIACTIGEADPLYSRSTSSGTMWCDDLTLTKIRTLSRTHLSGQHVALDVYTDDYLYFNDPTTYVTHLDEVYEAMASMVNGVPFNGDLITIRSDASMYYGLLSGNPITIGPGHSWPDIVNAHGIDWGVPHELGHDFDLWPQSQLYMGQMTFDGAEQWANLKVLYAYEVLGALYPNLTNETVPLNQVGQRFVDIKAKPWIDDGQTDYQNMNNDVYTGLLYTLRKQVGWTPFIETFHEYSASSNPIIPPSDEAKVELWANTLSNYAGVDFIPAFQSWGFPIQQYTYHKVYLPLVLHDFLDSSTTFSTSVSIISNNQDGFEDPAFHISGDGYTNDWIGTSTTVIGGWIFSDISIPRNATILESYVKFRGFGNGSATTRIKGFAENNAAVFTNDGANKPSARPSTAAFVDWSSNRTFAWQWFQTPNLSPILQEIVNRPGWATGNSLGFSISNPFGVGANWAFADYAGGPYDGAGGGGHSVTLYIIYTVP